MNVTLNWLNSFHKGLFTYLTIILKHNPTINLDKSKVTSQFIFYFIKNKKNII
jgi:hypothetical protein